MFEEFILLVIKIFRFEYGESGKSSEKSSYSFTGKIITVIKYFYLCVKIYTIIKV